MNILLTSVGRRSYLVEYFKNALGGIGMVHAVNSIATYALQTADCYEISPLIYSDEYIDFLLNYCLKNDISAVIPLFDAELPVLAANITLFDEHNIRLIVSDENAVKICNDKWFTYKFLSSHRIAVPKTFLSIDEVKTQINTSEISFPIIIKPRWGNGSIGLFTAENSEELEVLYNKVKRTVFSTHLKYESAGFENESVIFQEFLSGEEYGIDIFNDLSGNFLSAVPKKKIEMRAGETNAAVTINDSQLAQLAQKISGELRHIGNLDIDMILSNGKYHVIDMNCRFGGQYPFSHLAGVDFAKATISMLKNEPIDPAHLTWQDGVHSIKNIQPLIFEKL